MKAMKRNDIDMKNGPPTDACLGVGVVYFRLFGPGDADNGNSEDDTNECECEKETDANENRA